MLAALRGDLPRAEELLLWMDRNTELALWLDLAGRAVPLDVRKAAG